SRYTSDRAFRIEPGRGFGGLALQSGRPLRTDDYVNDPAFSKDYLDAVARDDTVSAMVVPIKSDERVVGLLYVANRTKRPFRDRDEAILLRLADEAAVAIRNAQLFANGRASGATARSSKARSRASISSATGSRCSSTRRSRECSATVTPTRWSASI